MRGTCQEKYSLKCSHYFVIAAEKREQHINNNAMNAMDDILAILDDQTPPQVVDAVMIELIK